MVVLRRAHWQIYVPEGWKNTVLLSWKSSYHMRKSYRQVFFVSEEILRKVTRFIAENKLPHLLFYGPPGTGKTTTILACARKMYGASFKSMILEVSFACGDIRFICAFAVECL